MRRWTMQLLVLTASLWGLALADASDSKTFTVTVPGTEWVSIDTGSASLSVDYSKYCSAAGLSCTWYSTITYSTNYTTNRKLVASATTTSPILSVVLQKRDAFPKPFVPDWGYGSSPGSWASGFSGTELTLSSADQDIVVGISNGTYAIAPIIKLVFSSPPPVGEYSATVTFTLMAQ